MNAILRLLRSGVSTFLGYYISQKMQDPRYMALAPIVMAITKYLRDKYPTNEVINSLPF